MIRYTYSTTKPEIQRLQGGVLYPYGIELVAGFGDEAGQQYRFKWLKFSDIGQDISDYDSFTEKYADEIAAYLKADVDLQKITAKCDGWESIDPPQEVEDE